MDALAVKSSLERVGTKFATSLEEDEALAKLAVSSNLSTACSRLLLKNFACLELPGRRTVLCGTARPNRQQQQCSVQDSIRKAKEGMDMFVHKNSKPERPYAIISLDHTELADIQAEAGRQGISAFSHGCGQGNRRQICYRDNEICEAQRPNECASAFAAAPPVRGESLIVPDFTTPTAAQLAEYIRLVQRLADGHTAVSSTGDHGVKHHILTHCAGGMGRTGLFLIAFMAYDLLKYESTKFIYWEDAVVEATAKVQQYYHANAGEFDEVPSNFVGLMNFLFDELSSTRLFDDTGTREFRTQRDRFEKDFMKAWKENKEYWKK